MKDKLLKIINHYDVNHQLKYFQSEIFELNEAIMMYEFEEEGGNYYISYKEHIAEKIADVMVMLEQFRYHYGIKNETIERIMEEKIDRQLQRIEDETGKTK